MLIQHICERVKGDNPILNWDITGFPIVWIISIYQRLAQKKSDYKETQDEKDNHSNSGNRASGNSDKCMAHIESWVEYDQRIKVM